MCGCGVGKAEVGQGRETLCPWSLGQPQGVAVSIERSLLQLTKLRRSKQSWSSGLCDVSWHSVREEPPWLDLAGRIPSASHVGSTLHLHTSCLLLSPCSSDPWLAVVETQAATSRVLGQLPEEWLGVPSLPVSILNSQVGRPDPPVTITYMNLLSNCGQGGTLGAWPLSHHCHCDIRGRERGWPGGQPNRCDCANVHIALGSNTCVFLPSSHKASIVLLRSHDSFGNGSHYK